MREMNKEEILSFIKNWTWGTLIALDGSGPYAIEVSYGTDGEYIYCGSRPGGRMYRCIKENPKVAFKICDTDKSCSKWHAVIIEGDAEKLTEFDDILNALRTIAAGMGYPENAFDKMAGEIAKNPESNSLKIPLSTISGMAMG